MKNFCKVLCTFILAFFIAACSQHFCSLDCKAPVLGSPYVNESIIQDFAPQDVLLYPKGNTLKIVLPTDKFFRQGSPTIKRNKTGTMAKVAELLKAYGNTATISIRGYTDTLASDEASRKLSLAQAQAVLAYLWSRGFDAEHLYSAGLGKSELVGDPHDLIANAANRRIEIVVQAHCTNCY